MELIKVEYKTFNKAPVKNKSSQVYRGAMAYNPIQYISKTSHFSEPNERLRRATIGAAMEPL